MTVNHKARGSIGAAFREWLPVVVLLGGGAVAYGGLVAEMDKLSEKVEELYVWRNDWQKTVLPLDATQNSDISHLKKRVDACCPMRAKEN